MSLLKKGKKKKLKMRPSGGAGVSSKRPQQVEKLAPCISTCGAGNDVRGWITTIAQREKSGISEAEAFEQAWRTLAETNPIPATMGRICPHPCEDGCNRKEKDGAVAINAMERFIGDWAIDNKLAFTKLEEVTQPESIGVIGAGPAGLTFAYQMARRGYPVTIYEAFAHAGGMLYYGIPFYRLPADVLQAEVDRIIDLGVDLKLNTVVGKDISVEELRAKHKVLFLGIGAHKGKPMRIPGEEGSGFYTGTDYLHRVTAGEEIDVGSSVTVIGGGDTAIDAARIAKRAGADVTIAYRRTRTEMPAIESEIEDALKEGVKIEYLTLPIEAKHDGDGKLTGMVLQKMELGEPDASGRRRPVPIEGSEYELPVSTMIAAISQQPIWIDDLKPKTSSGWLEPDPTGKIEDDVWAGGDVIDLGIAVTAMGHGTRAAKQVHEQLRGLKVNTLDRGDITPENLIMSFYEDAKPAERAHRPADEWVSKPDEEIDLGINHEQFIAEADRCFSCGLCFGCERCWMYCTPSCFSKIEPSTPGNYYTVRLDTCDGCNKCVEACPCGFLMMI